jgi:hypothetical protein
MAPERLAGKEVDGRADVYSAGVIFYRLLTGHLPFEAPTPLRMVQKQLSEAPTPVHVHRPNLPGWCQAILDRALARAPSDRFPTAEAFRTTLLAAISEATESTGVYAVVHGSGAAKPDDLTTATAVPLAVALPSQQADPLAVAAWSPPAAAAVPTSTPSPMPPPSGASAAAGTTVVLRKNQFALVGGLLLALVIGVVVLAIVALRRPPTVVVAPGQMATGSQTSAASSTSSSAPAPDRAASGSATPAPAPPASAPPKAPPVEIVAPPLVLPAPAPAPRRDAKPEAPTTPPAAPPTPVRPDLVTTPFRFDAKAVVADGDKRRERDALVLVADGAVTVTEKEKSAKALYVVPLDSLVGLTYSSSKQPLWDSPTGPAEAMKVEGGAFGFLKGGKNNWFGLRTKDSLLVLRVDDDAVRRVTAGLQERTGLTLQRLVEPKD